MLGEDMRLWFMYLQRSLCSTSFPRDVYHASGRHKILVAVLVDFLQTG